MHRAASFARITGDGGPRDEDAALNILLVEHDAAIGRALVRALSAEGYGVNWRQTAADAREALASGGFGLAILADGCPDMLQATKLCTVLRGTGIHMPLMILATSGALQDKLDGFAAGADDYLVKPFAIAELLARLNVMVRRRDRDHHREAVLTIGGMRLDVPARAISIGAAPLETSRREFDLLLCLARAGGTAVARDDLLNRVWGHKSDVTPNIVDVYIGYARQSLAAFAGAPQIVTVRGIGYRLAAQPAGRNTRHFEMALG